MAPPRGLEPRVHDPVPRRQRQRNPPVIDRGVVGILTDGVFQVGQNTVLEGAHRHGRISSHC